MPQEGKVSLSSPGSWGQTLTRSVKGCLDQALRHFHLSPKPQNAGRWGDVPFIG